MGTDPANGLHYAAVAGGVLRVLGLANTTRVLFLPPARRACDLPQAVQSPVQVAQKKPPCSMIRPTLRWQRFPSNQPHLALHVRE
jgi:hypothetical protein